MASRLDAGNGSTAQYALKMVQDIDLSKSTTFVTVVVTPEFRKSHRLSLQYLSTIDDRIV